MPLSMSMGLHSAGVPLKPENNKYKKKIWRDNQICMEDLLSNVLFSNPFQKKKRLNVIFRFELKNTLEV